MAGGGANGELHGLRRSVGDAVQGVHDTALRIFHSTHPVEDMGGGDEFGGDDTVQAQGANNAGVVLAVALGDYLGQALLHGVQRDDEVVLVPVGEGHKGIRVGEIF